MMSRMYDVCGRQQFNLSYIWKLKQRGCEVLHQEYGNILLQEHNINSL